MYWCSSGIFSTLLGVRGVPQGSFDGSWLVLDLKVLQRIFIVVDKMECCFIRIAKKKNLNDVMSFMQNKMVINALEAGVESEEPTRS